jgi:hypothetical protein
MAKKCTKYNEDAIVVISKMLKRVEKHIPDSKI